MSTPVYLLSVAAGAAIVFATQGFGSSSFIAIVLAATLMIIPWYFGTRDRQSEPGTAERIAAGAWLWLRRILCLLGAAIFLSAAGMVVYFRGSPGAPEPWWVVAPIAACVGMFLVYVGIVGQGTQRYAWRDDVALHQSNKRRYKWWF